MSKIIKIIEKVHEKVHDLSVIPKKQFSEPKIYCGGGDIKKWNSFSKSEKTNKLKKTWYVRWSYRNPQSGYMERQDNIKIGNYYKTKEERFEILEAIRTNLHKLLKNGYSPYADSGKRISIPSVKEGFEFALTIKKNTMSDNSYTRFKSRIKRFETYLNSIGFQDRFITSIDKKIASTYLNDVLNKTSARNRNNTRTDLRSLFEVLEDNEIIEINFISKINVIKSKPTRNKTFSLDQLIQIEKYLKDKKNLALFIDFVSYNFLRPVEVCRLSVGDINIKEKYLIAKAKNQKVKQKIIPDILFDKIPDLSNYKKTDILFTPNGYPSEWNSKPDNRRDYFTKEFKKVKDHFGWGVEYGIYSFRHTYITKLYRKLRKSYAPFEAKSRLMLITGHTSMQSLDKYLRDIDAELPEDYSELLK